VSAKQRRRIVGVARATIDGRKTELHDLMVDSGFLTADSSLTVDEAYQWWAGMLYEMLAPQPATYSAQTGERAIDSMLDMRSVDHPLRRMAVPADFVFFSRLNLSMNAVLSALGATLYVRSMLDDMDGIASPTTELGRRHDAWVRERGLPHGLDKYVCA
jgi:hypothetical protein